MKRAFSAIVATVIGLYWVVSFKVTPEPAQAAQADRATPPPATPGGTSTGSAAASGTPAPAASRAPAGSGSFTGSMVSTIFGEVQVRVTVSGGKITDVQPLQLPFDRSRSAYISQVAGPMLHDEVLQAQSANIDIISGATYTSMAYARSVQSALQQSR